MSLMAMLQPKLRSRRFDPPVNYGITRVRPRRRPDRKTLHDLGTQLIRSSTSHIDSALAALRELDAHVRQNLARLDDDAVRAALARMREVFEFHFERAFHDTDIAGEVWTRVEYRAHGYRDEVSEVELEQRRETSNVLRIALLEHRERLWGALGPPEKLGRLAAVPPRVDVENPHAEMRRRYDVRIIQCEFLGEEDQLRYWQGRLDDLINFDDAVEVPPPEEDQPAGDEQGGDLAEEEEASGGPQSTEGQGQPGARHQPSSRRKRRRGQDTDLPPSKRARTAQSETADSDEEGLLPYKTLEQLPWNQPRVRKINAQFPSDSDIPAMKTTQDQKVHPYPGLDQIPDTAPALPDLDLYDADEDEDAEDHVQGHNHEREGSHGHDRPRRRYGASGSRPRMGPEPPSQGPAHPQPRSGAPPAGDAAAPGVVPLKRHWGPVRRRRQPPKPWVEQRPPVSAREPQAPPPGPRPGAYGVRPPEPQFTPGSPGPTARPAARADPEDESARILKVNLRATEYDPETARFLMMAERDPFPDEKLGTNVI